MIPRTVKLIVVVLALSTAVAARADSGSSSGTGAAGGNARQANYERLSEELKRLETGLPAKKEELARLRRKWVVIKGRMPTQQELEDYEEKLAEGEAEFEDNPYVNKNPLSSPGRYRAAYYAMLNEIKGDEARIARLKEEIAGLNR